MRAVVQRVSQASVVADGVETGRIGPGLMVLVGCQPGDAEEDIRWLSRKLVGLRIFPDDDGRMNRSVQDIDGEILVVSQFTLFASTKKGMRPAFLAAAEPAEAIPLYQRLLEQLATDLGKSIPAGVFGADMAVSLVNDGPVTIPIDTRRRE